MPEYRHKSNDFKEWVEKFGHKTTDDVFTPPDVYDGAVALFYKITGDKYKDLEIIRPFYPNGDYTKEDYTGKIVIDNPPFSIAVEIQKWYNEHGVKYFLFGNGLTLFNKHSTGFVVCHSSVNYDGCKVSTGFVSNCFEGIYGVYSIGEYKSNLKQKRKLPEGYETSATLRKYIKPENDLDHLKKWDFDKNLTSREAFGMAYKVKENDGK